MVAETAALATRLKSGRPLVATGVFDALSAVLAQRAGFEALFVSGSALALTQLARPDVGLLTLTELTDTVARICQRVDVPVLVDADYGFGNALNVARTVQVLERAGARGIQLEDRMEAAPPSAMARRPVVDMSTMLGKLRAALDARETSATVISARTDALYTNGLDDALERAERFIETGADMVFIEGCVTEADRRQVLKRLASRAPVLFNTGILVAADLPAYTDMVELGYSVLLFPGVTAVAAAVGMQGALDELQAWTRGSRFSPPTFDAGAAISAASYMEHYS